MVATAANLAGEPGTAKENCFEGLAGFNGDAGRERWGFWGEPKTGRTGDRSVREFRDLGESTVEGFVTWREGGLAVFFGLFLGFGILCAGSGVFSLSALSKCSLQWVQWKASQVRAQSLYLDLFTPIGRGEGATSLFSAFGVFFPGWLCWS